MRVYMYTNLYEYTSTTQAGMAILTSWYSPSSWTETWGRGWAAAGCRPEGSPGTCATPHPCECPPRTATSQHIYHASFPSELLADQVCELSCVCVYVAVLSK